jgi:hypothetical protein
MLVRVLAHWPGYRGRPRVAPAFAEHGFQVVAGGKPGRPVMGRSPSVSG